MLIVQPTDEILNSNIEIHKLITIADEATMYNNFKF